jgi:hypothetical protein
MPIIMGPGSLRIQTAMPPQFQFGPFDSRQDTDRLFIAMRLERRQRIYRGGRIFAVASRIASAIRKTSTAGPNGR